VIATVDTRKFDSTDHFSDDEDLEQVGSEPLMTHVNVDLDEEAKGDTSKDEIVEEYGDTAVYRIVGQLSYINSPAHEHRMEKILTDIGIKNIVFCLKYCWYIDLDGIDILKEMVTVSEAKEKVVVLAGVKNIRHQLSIHPFFQEKEKISQVFTTYSEALEFLSISTEEAAKKILPIESTQSTESVQHTESVNEV